MRDLTQHLTARADDNHAAPCFVSLKERLYRFRYIPHIQAQVRFLAYHRIKPHAPPLVRTPVNSFEFHLAAYSPRWILNALLAAQNYPKQRVYHRLGRGLPGYLILFAPHAFVPQRQYSPAKLPSQSVFYDISKHFTATCHIPPTSTIQVTVSTAIPQLSCMDFTPDLYNRLRTL